MRATAIIAAAATALLGACVSLTPTAIDQRSSAAGRVQREANVTGAYPTFADIPATPRDVRTVAQYDAAVGEQQALATTLNAWPAANPAVNIDTQAFAEAQRRTIAEDARGAGLPPPDQGARSAAYAAAARARAAPPAPPR